MSLLGDGGGKHLRNILVYTGLHGTSQKAVTFSLQVVACLVVPLLQAI